MAFLSSDSSSLLAHAFTQLLVKEHYSVSVESLSKHVPLQERPQPEAWLRAIEGIGASAKLSHDISLNALQVTLKSAGRILLLPDNITSDLPAVIVESSLQGDSLWNVVNLSVDEEQKAEPLKPEDLDLSSFSYCVSLEVAEHSQEDVDKPFSAWLRSEVNVLAPIFRDVILASAMINLFALASPLYVMNIYDRVVPNQAIETLWVLSTGLLLVVGFDVLVKTLRYRFVERANRHLDIVLSSKLFSGVMDIKHEYFPASVGGLAGKLRDFELIKQFLTASTITAVVDLPFFVFFLLVIFMVGGNIVWVPIIASLVLLLYGVIVHVSLRNIMKSLGEAASEKNAVLVESLGVLELIQSHNAQGRQLGLWERALLKVVGAGVKSRQIAGSINIVSSAVMQLNLVFIVVSGVYLINEQQLSMGALIACVLLGSRALAPISQMANLLVQYFNAQSAKKVLDDLSSLPRESAPNKQYLSLPDQNLSIECRDLSFYYSSDSVVLDKVSINIAAGEKVAIIGRIGSGKSTLIKMLSGLYEAKSGSVLVGGLDLRHVDKSQLRSRVGYVSQNIELLSGTLKENITLSSPELTQEKLLRAIEIAGLKEFVSHHPKGIDMDIGEGGKGLSGGQKQCVAIARAFAGEPEILLFDELTSSMDNQTEQTIIAQVKSAAANKTMILSTHRASLLTLVDRIIVMDEGKVIADGKKEVVLNALKQGLIKAGAAVNSAQNNPPNNAHNNAPNNAVKNGVNEAREGKL